MNIETVNELIASLESAGELSIKERKYLELAKEFKQLAAENVALKKFCKNAAFDADYEAELGMERGGFTDALNNIETPATDRIVAEAEAQGAEAYVTALVTSDDDDFAYEPSICVEETLQLREGAK